ncbi:MAG TPA: DUF448 domain-containing protein [Firmicutes bacterium]|nr:DUF448 domain-containing protein [Bacillota bacterium]
MNKAKYKPLRRCAICRRPLFKEDLARYVRLDGRLVEGQTLPGRGVYVCSSQECRERFERKHCK